MLAQCRTHMHLWLKRAYATKMMQNLEKPNTETKKFLRKKLIQVIKSKAGLKNIREIK
jgi:predicted TIM-barrel fold metal-dependent hydrolase